MQIAGDFVLCRQAGSWRPFGAVLAHAQRVTDAILVERIQLVLDRSTWPACCNLIRMAAMASSTARPDMTILSAKAAKP